MNITSLTRLSGVESLGRRQADRGCFSTLKTNPRILDFVDSCSAFNKLIAGTGNYFLGQTYNRIYVLTSAPTV